MNETVGGTHRVVHVAAVERGGVAVEARWICDTELGGEAAVVPLSKCDIELPSKHGCRSGQLKGTTGFQQASGVVSRPLCGRCLRILPRCRSHQHGGFADRWRAARAPSLISLRVGFSGRDGTHASAAAARGGGGGQHGERVSGAAEEGAGGAAEQCAPQDGDWGGCLGDGADDVQWVEVSPQRAGDVAVAERQDATDEGACSWCGAAVGRWTSSATA
jgi:hypothetical protein